MAVGCYGLNMPDPSPPPAKQPPWPLLTIGAIVAGFLLSQWIGPLFGGPDPAVEQQPADPPPAPPAADGGL